ncbi:MAG: HAD-IIIC family phosphatase [Sphingobium sp.]|nr:HAD-IIIC family phosphatase [Sphingobium sp.]
MANTPIMAEISPAVGKALARRLRRQAGQVAADWAERHRAYPAYLDNAVQELGDWTAYAGRFAKPLLAVLALGLHSGQDFYFHIYANERLRFAAPDDGGEDLCALLSADEQALPGLLGLEEDGREARALRAILARTHRLLTQEGDEVRFAFVGDCVMTEIQSFLRPGLAAAGRRLSGQHFYFSARLGAALDAQEVLRAMERKRFDLIALSFLTFEGLPIYTALLREAGRLSATERQERCDALLALIDAYLRDLRAETDAPILLHGCSGLPIERWRRYLPLAPAMSAAHADVALRLDTGLRAMSEGLDNVIFVDERAFVAPMGLRAADRRLLPRTLTHGGLFHPSRFGLAVSQDYVRIARAYAMLAKTKVLLVDFDNTLWEGVMADGPVQHDLAAQSLLKELKEAGILLVSVSKNSEANVRWDEMVLKPDDFVLHKISWDLKAKSVLEIADQLNLDPKSFVLIDDNPVERDLITSTVAGVTALDPLDPATWPALALLMRFPATRATEEARRRTEMYREAAARREASSAKLDYGAMMHSLELKVGWRKAGPSDLDRLNELINRTNQFNTTTVRYSMAELGDLIADEGRDVFVSTLSDKFGSLGVVGVVITRVDQEELHFENVVMSCRAMGFGLESQLVHGPLAARPGRRRAVGLYIPTERNGPCADLFALHGFQETEPGRWALDLNGAMPSVPDWLHISNG